jgi:hypothetical protein
MYEQFLYWRYTFHSHSRVRMNNVCIAVIHFTVTVGMYEQCLYCRYTFHSHSMVCMNNACIAVIYLTVTVGYV